jgi:hypothetical protein
MCLAAFVQRQIGSAGVLMGLGPRRVAMAGEKQLR